MKSFAEPLAQVLSAQDGHLKTVHFVVFSPNQGRKPSIIQSSSQVASRDQLSPPGEPGTCPPHLPGSLAQPQVSLQGNISCPLYRGAVGAPPKSPHELCTRHVWAAKGSQLHTPPEHCPRLMGPTFPKKPQGPEHKGTKDWLPSLKMM